MDKNDHLAKLALRGLERRTRLIRRATSNRSRAGQLVWTVLAIGVLLFICRHDDPFFRAFFGSSFVLCSMQAQSWFANRRLDALTELLEVEKLWQTDPES